MKAFTAALLLLLPLAALAGEARSVRDPGIERVQADATVTPYEVRQAPTGQAGVYDDRDAAASGDYVDLRTTGEYTLVKTAGFVALKGNRAYWDASANSITYKPVNDRDFYVGRFAEDALSTATSCVVDLNIDPAYDVDLARDPFASVYVGTQGLNTMGVFRRGGAHKFILSATNEAQKLDALSRGGFSKDANAIVEFAFCVVSDGAGTVVDVSLGAANGTNATDADSITESCFVHLDANNTNINAESDDGTTEVAATDTTTDYTEGATISQRVEVWMDFRDPADVQIYVNGSLVLTATVFNVNAATGPFYLLAHVEKTASTDTYEIDLDWMRAHFAEQ